MRKRNIIYRNRSLLLAGLAIFVSIFSLPKLSQAVDGISSGKLIMPWAYTQEKGAFEFEPAVSMTTFDDVLDSDGELVSLEGRYQISTIDIRFTGGLTEKLEMGAAFGIESVNFHHEEDPLLDESETSLGDLALGWKYRVWGENEEKAIAVEWGIGLPWVSHASYAVWEAGLIFSLPLGDKWSLDLDGTGYLTSETSPGDPEVGATSNIGIAVDLNDSWTVAAELNGFWERTRSDDIESWKITPALGFAYGFSDTLSVCILGQQDVEGLGKNTELATVVQMLFTFAFE